MKPILITLLAFAAATAFGQQKEFSWLVGTWKHTDKNLYEVWVVAEDGKTLAGKSYKISGQDTVINETIKIQLVDGVFYYVPTVAENPGPVLFKISKYDHQSFVAENPQHDFPKIIRYHRRPSAKTDGLEAVVEGGGKSIQYVFERVQ